MKKSIFNRLAMLAACGLSFASAATGYALPSVTYLDWDNEKKEMVVCTVTDYEPVTSETRTFENGKWYVVTGNVVINDGHNITVNGAAHLVLCDDSSLTVSKVGDKQAAIDVSAAGSVTNALSIYGQGKGTGRLEATGSWYGAGIGGGDNAAGGIVTINGGMVTATGGRSGAAGIGGGLRGTGGTVTINGGMVTAVGGEGGAAGIGGGYQGTGGTVTINGGTVTANGDAYGAGIGGGENAAGGTVTINGGTVTATGFHCGAGIGSGSGGGFGGTVTISGGTVTATGVKYSAGIGGGWHGAGGSVKITGGTVAATGGESAAGIGGGYEAAGGSGTTTISGGEVVATGGANAAGIGGGEKAAGGTTTISGGTVTATGGAYAAGIGGGNGGKGGTTTINGGQVKAVGQDGGKGIGAGHGVSGATIKITNGTVDAAGWNGLDGAVIDGGSIKTVSLLDKAPISTQPTNTVGISVYCVTVALSEEVEAKSEALSVEGLKDYGVKDIYPLDGNKLYFYLPNGDYDFSVNGNRYLAFVNNGGTTAMEIKQQTLADGLPFDGVLMQDGRTLGNTNATALVRVDGANYDVAIWTDADGRFATSLPRQATPASKVVFVSAKVGGMTIAVDRPLTVPQLPYAFGADYADEVIADDEFTVVDSEVTVLGDLNVDENVTVGNDTLVGSVNGGITVGQPSPAESTVLREITAADDATRIYGIGDPITVLDAHLEGAVTESFAASGRPELRANIALGQASSPRTVDMYRIDRSENFVIRTPTYSEDPILDFEHFYEAYPDSDPSKSLAYTAVADGFVTVEIKSTEPSYGGIALTVDFKDCHFFEPGWHRSAFNPEASGGKPPTERLPLSIRPAFNRDYTFTIRRGETMHVRAVLSGFFAYDASHSPRYQDACPINLHVKVTFRPIGFAE